MAIPRLPNEKKVGLDGTRWDEGFEKQPADAGVRRLMGFQRPRVLGAEGRQALLCNGDYVWGRGPYGASVWAA